jgi:hypothetical protein
MNLLLLFALLLIAVFAGIVVYAIKIVRGWCLERHEVLAGHDHHKDHPC